MAALKTHLLRGVYDWAVENGFTPHVVVDARAEGVRVPPGYDDETGRIVLNIHPRALHGFSFDDTWIRFSARFGSASFNVELPLEAVLAIYAKENGQGISFPDGTAGEDDGDGPSGTAAGAGAARKKPGLRVVK